MYREGSLCVCCMSTDELVELYSPRIIENIEENYAKILICCLNIKISENDGQDAICETCIRKLRECVAFKRQVLKSISVLSSTDIKELLTSEELQVLGIQQTIKQSNETENEPFENAQNIEIIQEDANFVTDFDDLHIKDPSPVQIPCAENVLQQKRRLRKRPRKHPRIQSHSGHPYTIERDEMKCRECGEEFPNHVTLMVHYNKHFSNHVCGICKKGFITRGGLKKHEASHQVGPFLCEVCAQEFRNINTLYSHKRYKHGKSLPFRCKDCGKEFPTLQRRIAHAAETHAQTERRYECRYCKQKFRYSGERSKHIADKHEVKLFACPLCGSKYKRRYLRVHLLLRHGVGEGPSCEKCGAVRASRAALLEHMRQHSDDRRYVCKLCSQGFVQKRSLKYHVGAHVRRGDYHGDPDFLMTTKEENETGILSGQNSIRDPDKKWPDDLSEVRVGSPEIGVRITEEHVGSPQADVVSPEARVGLPKDRVESPEASVKPPETHVASSEVVRSPDTEELMESYFQMLDDSPFDMPF